jgi:hypothetical protein
VASVLFRLNVHPIHVDPQVHIMREGQITTLCGRPTLFEEPPAFALQPYTRVIWEKQSERSDLYCGTCAAMAAKLSGIS